MNRKSLSIWVSIISLFSVFFGYTLVFAGNLGEIKFKLSSNLFLDSLNLNKSKIIINSKSDLSNMEISGDCGVVGELSDAKDNVYSFDIYSTQTTCDKNKVTVKFKKDDLILTTYFIPIDSIDLYSDFLDYSDEKLNSRIDLIDLGIQELQNYESYDKNSQDDYFVFLENNRKLQELKYMRTVISDILEKREEKYTIPLLGGSLTDKANKLPNSGRPYRDSYTDGIHHGWDFDADYGAPVVSLDYGIVIRIVDDFSDYDYTRIDYSDNLTYLEKLQNLDILRGNQVWVKTMKGDVAFYSHLSKVYDNVEVGTVLSKGQLIGEVGATGVPDESYTDFHLHIPVHKNPYLSSGDYTMEDYLQWDWYFKGETTDYIVENQSNIFE